MTTEIGDRTMLTARDLPSMRGSQLDALFANAPAGEIPVGKGSGQALMATGTFAARPLLAITRLLAWQGKVFDGPSHTLRNLISPFGFKAITPMCTSMRAWPTGDRASCSTTRRHHVSPVGSATRSVRSGPVSTSGWSMPARGKLPIRFSLGVRQRGLRILDIDHEAAAAVRC